MTSTAEFGKVTISEEVYEFMRKNPRLCQDVFFKSKPVMAQGKGMLNNWQVSEAVINEHAQAAKLKVSATIKQLKK